MKTLIGITSFGGLPFLELAICSLQETVTEPNVDILVVVGKPDDSEMRRWLEERSIRYIQNPANNGFPSSVNDCYDAAFVDGDYSNLIIQGNDVVAMPGAIDTMIQRAASEPEFDIFCASEFNSRFLFDNYPEARKYFHGENLFFNDFTVRPWELHKDFRENTIQPDTLKDVRNLTLFKRRCFEAVGYADVNFWPNGYWEDNDYARRCHLLGMRAAGLPSASFFHFWSRTIHQNESRDHGKYYTRNQDWYERKWGTRTWGEEKFATPFETGPIDIPDRDGEEKMISYWRDL